MTFFSDLFGNETTKQLKLLTQSIDQLTRKVNKMSEDVRRLQEEVAAETAEDVRTSEQIEAQRAQIAELKAAAENFQPLVDAAKAGEANALAQLEEVLVSVREVTDQLAADNPVINPL